MKISLNWLKRYIQLSESIDELQNLLTFAGIEVEAVITVPKLPESIISARVVLAEAVPKTDHLQRCLVDIGEYPYPEKDNDNLVQLICGAPNCHSGLMALIAMPGSVLPEFTISKAKIRGVESHGMLCSEKELGISDNHAGIIELSADTPIGVSANNLYELPDTVFELEITPNRPDLLGYIGIARDLSAKLNRPLLMPEIVEQQKTREELPLQLINENPLLCPRYIARLFRNVRIAPSPLWMKAALIKSGLRPKNNLVDITNYVMLEFGHPLHAFDYKMLSPLPGEATPAIVVRNANQDETFTTLDGRKLSLDGDELVIADGEKPSALAGVMGGELSGIEDCTQDVVLESAAFEPGSIRKTTYKHKISTDTSYRFERHLSDYAPDLASRRAAQLICELSGAELCATVHDNWLSPTKPLVLGIRPSRYKQLIGYILEDKNIKEYLEKLGLKFLQYGSWKPGIITDVNDLYCHHTEEMKQGKTEFTELPDCVHTLYFEIPVFRVDLIREVDLIEELARLDGYDKVPQKTKPSMIMDRHAYRLKKVAADYIVNRGFFETLNYSFSEPALMQKLGYEEDHTLSRMIQLINPQSSNMSAMRTSLIPNLLHNLLYNLNHGERNIKLFELGKTYHQVSEGSGEPIHLAAIACGQNLSEHWQEKPRLVNACIMKGVVEELFELLALNDWYCKPIEEPYLSPRESVGYYHNDKYLGFYGKLKSSIASRFGIDTIELKQDIWLIDIQIDVLVHATRQRNLRFTEIPRFPNVVRDISFLISQSVTYHDIRKAVLEMEPNLITDVTVFDEYHGKQIPEGFRSLSLHIKLQDKEKTLTDERMDQLVESIIKKLQDTWQITMR